MWRAAAACLLAAAAAACHQPSPHEPAPVITAFTGGNVTLSCPLDARRAATGWAYFTPNHRRHHRCRMLALAVDALHYTTGQRYTVWRTPGPPPPRWQLTIAHVTPADAGLYRCHALYELPVTADSNDKISNASRWMQLVITAADRTLIDDDDYDDDYQHHRHHHQRSRRLLAGRPLELRCSAVGAVSWRRDGWPLGSGAVLRLNVTTEADSGVYSCHALGLRPDSVRVDVVSPTAATTAAAAAAGQQLPFLLLQVCIFLAHGSTGSIQKWNEL